MISRPLKIKTKLKIIKGSPDLTAMVDVLFLLLIFFILGSSFVQVYGIKIELPETMQTNSRTVEKFVVTVDEDGKFYFNDQPVKWEALQEKLLQLSTRHNIDKTVATIILRADQKTPFGVVAKLLGIAEEINFNVVIATVPEKGRIQRFPEEPER